MTKGFKRINGVYLGRPRPGSTTRYTTLQSVAGRPKFHAWEIIIYGLLIFLLMTGSYWRNRVWESELELWTDCVKKSPNKDRPHNNLGDVFLNQGKYQEATSAPFKKPPLDQKPKEPILKTPVIRRRINKP